MIGSHEESPECHLALFHFGVLLTLFPFPFSVHLPLRLSHTRYGHDLEKNDEDLSNPARFRQRNMNEVVGYLESEAFWLTEVHLSSGTKRWLGVHGLEE